MTGSIGGLGKGDASSNYLQVPTQAQINNPQTNPQIQKIEAQIPKAYTNPSATSSGSSAVLPTDLQERRRQLDAELALLDRQKQQLHDQARAMGFGDLSKFDLTKLLGNSFSLPPSNSAVKVEQKGDKEIDGIMARSKQIIFRSLLNNKEAAPQEQAELKAMGAHASKLSEEEYARVEQIQEAIEKRQQQAELTFVENRTKDLTPQECIVFQPILRRRDNLGPDDVKQVQRMKMRLLQEDLTKKALGEVNSYLAALKQGDDFIVKMEAVEEVQKKQLIEVAQNKEKALVVRNQMQQTYESNKSALTPYLGTYAAQKEHMKNRLRLLKGTPAEVPIKEFIKRADEMTEKINAKTQTSPLLLKTEGSLLALPAPKKTDLPSTFSSLSLTSTTPSTSSLSTLSANPDDKLFNEFVDKKTPLARKRVLCDQVAKKIENFSVSQFRQICSVLLMLKKEDLLKSFRLDPRDVRYKHIEKYLGAIKKVEQMKCSSLYSILMVNLDPSSTRSAYELLQIEFLARDTNAIKEHIAELISTDKFNWKAVLCLLSDNQDETSIVKAVAEATNRNVAFDEDVLVDLKAEVADIFSHLHKEDDEVDFVCKTLDKMKELLGQFGHAFDLDDSKKIT